MNISYPIARLLSIFAENRAFQLSVPMAVAFVDAKGGLVYFGRMGDVLPASNEIAIAKAYSAAAFRMSTQRLGELAQPGGMLYGIEHSLKENIVLFGGGVPLRCGGQVIGAVGISGGTVDEDIDVAQVVFTALQEMESWRNNLSPLLPRLTVDSIQQGGLTTALEEVLVQIKHPESKHLAQILAGAILIEGSRQQLNVIYGGIVPGS